MSPQCAKHYRFGILLPADRGPGGAPMTAFCCEVCPNAPTCADLLNAAFAQPGDVIDEPHLIRGEE